MKESLFLTLVFILVGCGYLSQANGIVRVVDGDTIEWNNKMIRIAGIDTPEMSKKCDDAENKSCGISAKLALENFLNGKKVECKLGKKDKYRRYISKCYADEVDVAQYMVQEGYARAYLKYSDEYIIDEVISKNE